MHNERDFLIEKTLASKEADFGGPDRDPNCPDVILLMAVALNRVPEGQAREVEAHCAGCRPCRRRLEDYRTYYVAGKVAEPVRRQPLLQRIAAHRGKELVREDATQVALTAWLKEQVGKLIPSYPLNNEQLINALATHAMASPLWTEVGKPVLFFLSAGRAVRDLLRAEASRLPEREPAHGTASDSVDAQTAALMKGDASTTGYGRPGDRDLRQILSLDGARHRPQQFQVLDRIVTERGRDDQQEADALLLFYFTGRHPDHISSWLGLPAEDLLDLIKVIELDFTGTRA